MPKISVLMSVYNETAVQIEEAVQSILDQTFSDFELLIVNDAPSNPNMSNLLATVQTLSKDRIKIYNNETNIGLALSMNRAAELSTGKYIARMDADDISLPERFQKEVQLLDSGKYDFVFTNYVTINDNGEFITKTPLSPNYNDDVISDRICEENIIHHPTVMMKRDVFEKAGRYRNFPCAQDYDLWLRLVSVGCRFHMINEVLFHYRVRRTSITSKKRLQQKLTMDYARKLYIERLKTGTDSYKYEGYIEYVQKNIKKHKNAEQQLDTNRLKLQKAYQYKRKGNLIGFFVCRVSVFLGSSVYRASYLDKVRNKREIKKVGLEKRR